MVHYIHIYSSSQFIMIPHELLVGGVNHLEKYEFVNGKD